MGLAARSLGAMLCLAFAAVVSGGSCIVSYSANGKPLLFGGITERCQTNCQARGDYWGNLCRFNMYSGNWGVCTDEQAKRSFEIAKTVGGGAILNLSPCDILPFLRGRTLWIIGDSHAKSLYRALQCFLLDYWNHQECEASTEQWKVQQLLRLPAAPGQSYYFHLLSPGGGRVCLVQSVLGTSLVRNDQVADGGVLPLLRNKFAKPQDIFYINFGIWHKKLAEWNDSYKVALKNLGELYMKTKWDWPHLLFRETPAEHQRLENKNGCQAARGFLYNTESEKLEVDPAARSTAANFNTQWQLGIFLNDAAKRIMKGYGIPVVGGFNATVPLNDAHLGNRVTKDLDCVHYCQPGIPQTWVYYMFDAFRKGAAGVAPIPEDKPANFQCIKSTQTWFN